MDERILNDLLECSVCLERLDTSSKVLPCQHTFCKKCLEGIVKKHKELKCPECRILVPIKIEDLPPNVLLMRILEGMKNAVSKKDQQITTIVNTRSPGHQAVLFDHNTPTALEHKQYEIKHGHPHIYQCYAKALYDYTSGEPGDLCFKRNDVIIVKRRIDKSWFHGECNGKMGLFPVNFVQVITPLPSNIPQCKALYDFHMTNDEEDGCLSFNKDDIITVIRRVDENWAEGRLYEKIGIFPLAFVEMNGLARSLMKLSTNVQPGPSRLAPPTPSLEISAQPIPTDHPKIAANIQVVPQHLVHQQTTVYQSVQTPATYNSSSSSNSSSATPNMSSGNTSCSSSPSSSASPPLKKQTVTARTARISESIAVNYASDLLPSPSHTAEFLPTQQYHQEKRHSFTSSDPQQHQTNIKHRHSAEVLNSEVPETLTQQQQAVSPLFNDHKSRKGSDDCNLGPVQLPAIYIALYSYKPLKADELELRKGGIYVVKEKCQDGWFKGTSLDTSNCNQKCGVFPGNYVALFNGIVRFPYLPSSKLESGSKTLICSAKPPSSQLSSGTPPELPPRSVNPSVNTSIASGWHKQENVAIPLSPTSNVTAANVASEGRTNKQCKEHQEKNSSIIRRLTSIKRSKSPPASSYSMDNPVFEDRSASVISTHPIHVRSGSCPSQLLQTLPVDQKKKFVSSSQHSKQKEKSSIHMCNARNEGGNTSRSSSPSIHQQKKSNSLDSENKNKAVSQCVRERFRCITPYPPNGGYELELQVGDIIYVHKKRGDGWYKGTQQRTGRTGLFPASFVESF